MSYQYRVADSHGSAEEYGATDDRSAIEHAEQIVAGWWEDHRSCLDETEWAHATIRILAEEGDWSQIGRVVVSLDPPVPDCVDGGGHDWDQTEVSGSGGGVRIKFRCDRDCGWLLTEDTWHTDPVDGQPRRWVRYRPEEPSVPPCAGCGIDLALYDDQYAAWDLCLSCAAISAGRVR